MSKTGLHIEKRSYRFDFQEAILGSMPADPAIHSRFIASKAPSPWLQQEEEQLADDSVSGKSLTVFPSDEKGIFFYNYHIKGFIKESGNVLKDMVGTSRKKKGEDVTAGIKNLRAKIDRHVFINPRRIYITKNGELVKEEDRILERPLRGQTMQGERVALVSSELIEAPCEIEFTIELLANEEGITWDVIETLLDYGRLKGLGQWRNGGFGSFEWTAKVG